MITGLYYFIVSLFLIIIQTTFIPVICPPDRYYDLIIPFIIYLGIFSSFSEGMAASVLTGVIADNLSAGPFGLYTTAYFWIFIIIKTGIKYIHIANYILWPIIILTGVLIENFVLIGTIVLFGNNIRVSGTVFYIILYQVFWAVVTGPFLIIIMNLLKGKWKEVFSGYRLKKE